MIEYLFIGLVVSIGWHAGQVIMYIVRETLFNILHDTEWYCRLNKMLPPKQPKKKSKEVEPYKGTVIGFMSNRES